MLVGAFSAVAFSYASGNGYVGIVCGTLLGILTSLLLAFGAITRRGNPIVLGVAINLLAVGTTGFLLLQLFGVRGVFQSRDIIGIGRLAIPGLSSLPIVGRAFFQLTVRATSAARRRRVVGAVPHAARPAPARRR